MAAQIGKWATEIMQHKRQWKGDLFNKLQTCGPYSVYFTCQTLYQTTKCKSFFFSNSKYLQTSD